MIILNNFKYSIDENNIVRVWKVSDSDITPPFLYQDTSPDGLEWKDSSEAEQFAVNIISNLISISNQQKDASETNNDIIS